MDSIDMPLQVGILAEHLAARIYGTLFRHLWSRNLENHQPPKMKTSNVARSICATNWGAALSESRAIGCAPYGRNPSGRSLLLGALRYLARRALWANSFFFRRARQEAAPDARVAPQFQYAQPRTQIFIIPMRTGYQYLFRSIAVGCS